MQATPPHTLTIRELTREWFADFGQFALLTPPDSEPLVSDDPIWFWPECAVADLGPLGNNQISFGVCQVAWRPLLITTPHTGGLARGPRFYVY